MTARLSWLLGGFALAFAALILWLVLGESPPRAPHASRPAMCEINELCDTAPPSPVDLISSPWRWAIRIAA